MYAKSSRIEYNLASGNNTKKPRKPCIYQGLRGSFFAYDIKLILKR